MEDPVAAGCKAVRAEVAVLPLHPSSPEDRHLREMPALELKDLAARYADKVGPEVAVGNSGIRDAGTAVAGARMRRGAADACCALPGASLKGNAAGKRSGCSHVRGCKPSRSTSCKARIGKGTSAVGQAPPEGAAQHQHTRSETVTRNGRCGGETLQPCGWQMSDLASLVQSGTSWGWHGMVPLFRVGPPELCVCV